MTELAWDQPGDRRYEVGIDRGVLYLNDGRVVVWNGLAGVDEATTREATSHYMDGMKYLERHIQGDFAATLRALTYPDEFNEVNGVKSVRQGLFYHEQRPQSFSLSYRTRIGNDLDGVDHGYRLHILFNVRATPSNLSFSSLGEQIEPSEFAWQLSSVPVLVAGYRPLTHVSIDSTDTDPDRLAAIERLLYGTPTSEPRLPGIEEFTTLFEMYDTLVITDNGDGTWTATDLTDSYITMLDTETFQIVGADATYLDADTYEISTTNTP